MTPDVLKGLAPDGDVTKGNDVQLFADGDRYFRAIWRDIAQASWRVWLDFYIVEDDSIGRRTRELLVEAARRGCEVRLIYDRFGSFMLDDGFFDVLRQAGARVIAFNNPVALLRSRRRLWSPLHRNHRKTLIIDHQISYSGGANIGEEYAGSELGNDRYHDLMVRIDGPATREIAQVYAGSWERATGEHIPISAPPRGDGGREVRVLRFDGRQGWHRLNALVCNLLDQAQERCFITVPYFIPPRWLRRAMGEAVRRGVDLRLMTSGDTDVPPALYAGRHAYAELLQGGVRFFEYFGQVLHDKFIVVDGRLAVIGSHNFDLWSERHNLEVGVAVADEELSAELEGEFYRNMARCNEIVSSEWQRRPHYQRALEWCAFQLACL